VLGGRELVAALRTLVPIPSSRDWWRKGLATAARQGEGLLGTFPRLLLGLLSTFPSCLLGRPGGLIRLSSFRLRTLVNRVRHQPVKGVQHDGSSTNGRKAFHVLLRLLTTGNREIPRPQHQGRSSRLRHETPLRAALRRSCDPGIRPSGHTDADSAACFPCRNLRHLTVPKRQFIPKEIEYNCLIYSGL